MLPWFVCVPKLHFSHYYFKDSFNIARVLRVYALHEIRILTAILKNGAIFRNALYNVEVGLSRALQRHITRPDIPTRS